RARLPDREPYRAVLPAVHHARHDHAAAVRHPAVRGLRQRDRAAADRRPGRGLPAVEHVLLLAFSVRWPDDRGGLPHPARCGRLRLDRLCTAVGCHLQSGPGGNLWVMGLAMTGFSTFFGSVNVITTILNQSMYGM